MPLNETDYRKILGNFVSKIHAARERAALSVNRELLNVYWEIGSTISRQIASEGWGTKVIERLSRDLKIEFPQMKGFSVRNIQYMKTFADAYPAFGKESPYSIQDAGTQLYIFTQAVLAQLPWYHHTTLLDKVSDQQTRFFYMSKSIENGWSRNIMLRNIETQLHLRAGRSINNFDLTLAKTQSDLAKETINNPMIFEFLEIGEEMKERQLERALILHLKDFMLELGRGFAYVGNQHKLVVENTEFFLDLLFYNYHLQAFVILEILCCAQHNKSYVVYPVMCCSNN